MYGILLLVAIMTGELRSTGQFIPGSRGHWWQDTTFLLNGRITGQSRGYIKLYYVDKSGNAVNDSCIIQNGRFKFSGFISGPTRAAITGNVKSLSGDPNATSFYLEPATINIKLTVNKFKNAVITGSKTEDENKILNKLEESVRQEMEPLNKEFEKTAALYRAAVKAKKR